MEKAEQYSLFQKSILIIMKGYVKSKKAFSFSSPVACNCVIFFVKHKAWEPACS